MKNSISNFEKLINQFAKEKGFVLNSNSQLWETALNRFNQYSEQFQNIMEYNYFLNNILKGF